MVEYLTLVERHRATVCFIVPPLVLAFLFQRLIVQGLVSGAVKG